MFWWLVLGVTTGMRTMTPIAIFCVMATMGLFPSLEHTWAAWTMHPVSAIVFTILALGEYVGDVLPRTPSRREYGPAISRIVFGGLVAAAAATAMVLPPSGGALLGIVGAVVGTSAGWWVRVTLGRRIGRDWPLGIAESALALGLAFLACQKIQIDAFFWNAIEKKDTAVLEPYSYVGNPGCQPTGVLASATLVPPAQRAGFLRSH